ncbi:expansin-A18-like [Silene latifolia]|uniref:expansin-A18-like n=1 Tax=Silene latifolia TaxID=37657 RepID=UPI003D77705E
MASNLQRFSPLLLIEIFIVLGMVRSGASVFQPTPWKLAHATFYGDDSAAETMGGACGYGNLYDSGYGTDTAALSTVLFNNGLACGSCYEMKCVESKWCLANAATITVTATNSCPPNWYQDTNNGGWCNPPREHFDLAKPAFNQLAETVAGIIPINYRRVSCQKTGGIRFKFEGNPNWLLVYVMNVGGSGDVCQMWVKGTNTDWISMSQNWGASYQAFSQLGGQALSFKLQSYTTDQIIILYNVAPANWCNGMTYQADSNFY